VRAFAADVVIGERDLERGVDGLEPELAKNMVETSGASAATRLASSNALGWAN
jgi:hypothetical protein